MGGGGLFDYSVNSWPRFDKVKARFSHVCDYVSKGFVRPSQDGQGQGQELDNDCFILVGLS